MGDYEDEEYARGVRDGQRGGFLDDFSQSLASTGSEYDKGYNYGIDHRRDSSGERYHTSDNQGKNDPKDSDDGDSDDNDVSDSGFSSSESSGGGYGGGCGGGGSGGSSTGGGLVGLVVLATIGFFVCSGILGIFGTSQNKKPQIKQDIRVEQRINNSLQNQSYQRRFRDYQEKKPLVEIPRNNYIPNMKPKEKLEDRTESVRFKESFSLEESGRIFEVRKRNVRDILFCFDEGSVVEIKDGFAVDFGSGVYYRITSDDFSTIESTFNRYNQISKQAVARGNRYASSYTIRNTVKEAMKTDLRKWFTSYDRRIKSNELFANTQETGNSSN